jgi:hypothetical protein
VCAGLGSPPRRGRGFVGQLGLEASLEPASSDWAERVEHRVERIARRQASCSSSASAQAATQVP